jgi:DNA ligase-1
MTKNDPPSPEPLIYHVFDMLTVAQWNGAEEVPPFVDRIDALIKAVQAIHSIAYTPVAAIWQANVDSYKQVKDLFDYQIAAGGEGLMLRDPKGLYKHGRCTLKEGNIFKFKLFEWIDAEVIAVNQLFTSFEDAEDDAFGHTKKSQKKADLRPIAMMGSLTVRTADGMEFNTGSGFTDAERTQLWKDRNNVLGRWCSVKHQPAGAKDLPRLPIFERWRPDLP